MKAFNLVLAVTLFGASVSQGASLSSKVLSCMSEEIIYRNGGATASLINVEIKYSAPSVPTTSPDSVAYPVNLAYEGSEVAGLAKIVVKDFVNGAFRQVGKAIEFQVDKTAVCRVDGLYKKSSYSTPMKPSYEFVGWKPFVLIENGVVTSKDCNPQFKPLDRVRELQTSLGQLTVDALESTNANQIAISVFELNQSIGNGIPTTLKLQCVDIQK